MLQKKRYITPTTRFANIINLIDNTVPQITKFIKKKKILNKSRKLFYRGLNFTLGNSLSLNYAAVIQAYCYNKKPYQVLLQAKSIYGCSLFIPGVETLTPGKRVFDFTKNLYLSQPSYTGSQVFLEQLPYHLFACYINNNYNNKKTFAKSSGTFGIKLKAKKTVKLILVKLPSGVTYLFLKTTKCFIGKNVNFFNNKFIEGKWGFAIHKSKTIHVRGVAMNPVDHPNGGRTKAKQPEKSPWGWIAKKCK